MKIIIAAVGKEKDFPAHELVADYTSRIEHYLPIEWHFIPASTPHEESSRLIRLIEAQKGGAHCILLDEQGKNLTSTQLASFVQTRLNEGRKSIIFLIGGAHGFDATIRNKAQTTLALSSLTFPHQLVRLILAEQLYRACTIMKGEKYHHE